MSSERKHNMEQDFHDRFHDWEAKPSPNAWDNIERRLDGEDDKKPVLWWWLGGIALLIVLGTVAWFLWPNNIVKVPQQIFAGRKELKLILKKPEISPIIQKTEIKRVRIKAYPGRVL